MRATLGTVAASRRATGRALFLGLTAVAACREITVPNYNFANVDQLTQSPTAKVVNGAVLGLLAGARGTYTNTLGVLGRENMIMDASEQRTVSVWLVGPLEQAVGGFVDFGWTAAYRQLRGGFTILDVVDRVANYTEEQKEAVRGVTKTFIAMAYIDQLRVRDTFGIVLDIDVDGRDIGEFVSRDSGYTLAAQLLDEARSHLAAAGATFPFVLTAGFNGFNTPATFIRFNRAIKARLEVYRERWSDALAALTESFIATPATGAAAAMATGVYNIYPSGEASNGLFQATPTTLIGLPSCHTDAQRRADNSLDLRASAKCQVTGTTLTLAGISSNMKLTVYASQNANVPIIKNEELVLLRAEANLALGDRAAALADVNYVRANSGGLAPLPGNFTGDLVGEILYNRRYSLMLEYGHRWVDMRRYGRLDQLEKMLPHHRVFPIIPLPQQECLARGNVPRGCVTVHGF
jgi:hypothetical protein